MSFETRLGESSLNHDSVCNPAYGFYEYCYTFIVILCV